jgi:hypothetical protein
LANTALIVLKRLLCSRGGSPQLTSNSTSSNWIPVNSASSTLKGFSPVSA